MQEVAMSSSARKGTRISRRAVLKSAAALAGSSAISGFPTVWAQNIKDVVLRHAGPPVTAFPQIAEQASKDLGFTVQMQASENADLEPLPVAIERNRLCRRQRRLHALSDRP
jgi:putative spermidine/putrescine transport system substrate-binding protein